MQPQPALINREITDAITFFIVKDMLRSFQLVEVHYILFIVIYNFCIILYYILYVNYVFILIDLTLFFFFFQFLFQLYYTYI